MGAPDEVLEHVKAKAAAGAGEGDFVVWRDNWESVTWLCDRLGTCWRWVSGMEKSRRIGLDYSAVVALMRELVPKRKKRQALLDDLQVMERAALDAWAEQDG